MFRLRKLLSNVFHIEEKLRIIIQREETVVVFILLMVFDLFKQVSLIIRLLSQKNLVINGLQRRKV